MLCGGGARVVSPDEPLHADLIAIFTRVWHQTQPQGSVQTKLPCVSNRFWLQPLPVLVFGLQGGLRSHR